MIVRALLAATALVAFHAQAYAKKSIDWPTFGGSSQRTGYNADETILSPATVPNLKLHWSANVGSANNLQPALLHKVVMPSGTFEVLFVTSANGVQALDTATGTVLWSVTMPTTMYTCLGKTKTRGVAEPATIDIRQKLLYVVDSGGYLHALSIETGAEQTGYPIEVIDADNLAAGTEVRHASPTLVDNILYITTAASCETKKVPYHGQAIRFDVKTAQILNRFYPVGNGSQLGGGMWGPGGLAAEPDGSYLWAGTANSLPPPQDGGNAEKIIQLDPKLNQVAVNGPILKTGSDLDFGSTPLLYQTPGCPPMLAAMNKSGIVLTYDRTNLATGPVQTLQISTGGGAGDFLGMPAFDPANDLIYLSNPATSPDGTYQYGLLALQSNASCQLSLLWHQTAGEQVQNGGNPAVPPTIANGVVWYAGGIAGQVAAFNAADGTPLWNSGTAVAGPTKAAPLVANGQVFFMGGSYVYAYGL